MTNFMSYIIYMAYFFSIRPIFFFESKSRTLISHILTLDPFVFKSFKASLFENH